VPIRYEVENTLEESVTIDGLGVLPPKSTTVINPDAVANFHFSRGLHLSQVNLPKGVEVTLLTSTDE
jgi:hypothetical protein